MKTLTMILLLTSSIGIYKGIAQGSGAPCYLYYYYDAAGNRILRTVGGECATYHMLKIDSPSTTLSDTSQNLTEALFPNPTAGPVSIIFNNAVAGAQILVVDNVGRQLLNTTVSGTNVPLDLSNLAQGVYYITVKAGSNTFVNNLVKQ